jgi:Regulator of ribonuclease activity B
VSRAIANADELDHAEEELDQLAADFGGEFDGHDC